MQLLLRNCMVGWGGVVSSSKSNEYDIIYGMKFKQYLLCDSVEIFVLVDHQQQLWTANTLAGENRDFVY
jgi:hypothetical protein